MTALVQPRTGQAWELGQACLEAARAQGEALQYWTGVVIGYCAAWNDDVELRDIYVQACRHPFAHPDAFDAAMARAFMLRDSTPSLIRSSGILFGFKQGTAEREDAAECTMCERRLLLAVDEYTHCDSHGTFCDLDCQRSVCHPHTRSCWEGLL